MRGTLKMVLPLMVSVAVGCLLFAAYQVHAEKRIPREDLLHHAETIGTSLRDAIEPLLDRQTDRSIQQLIERVGVREHLKGVVVYDASGTVLASTQDLRIQFQSRPAVALRANGDGIGHGEFIRMDDLPLHIYALPLAVSHF